MVVRRTKSRSELLSFRLYIFCDPKFEKKYLNYTFTHMSVTYFTFTSFRLLKV